MYPPVYFTNHTHYHSYLLRLWQTGEKGAPVLCVMLISPHTGERWSFASLEEMVRFLEDEMGKKGAVD